MSGISTDPRQLERLQQLEQVLELLQNPESYTRLLAEVKVTLKQQEEIAKRYTTIEAAEQFLQESRKLLNTTQVESKKQLDGLATVRSQFETLRASTLADLDARAATLATQESRTQNLLRELNERDLQLVLDRESFDASVETTTVKLSKQREDLDRRTAELTKKASDVSRILAAA
jgi:chromosome segregation ATPase